MATMSKASRKKMSEARKKQWNSFTPKQEREFREKRSKGMKRAWKRKSKEELAIIGTRMSARRYINMMKEKETPQEYIDAFLLDKFGFTQAQLEKDVASRRGKRRSWLVLRGLAK